jgi:hypothetical protein
MNWQEGEWRFSNDGLRGWGQKRQLSILNRGVQRGAVADANLRSRNHMTVRKFMPGSELSKRVWEVD